jgi:hypothetical protein
VIDNFNEINRILIAVNRLSHGNKGALETSVLRFCKDIVIGGRFPNHKSTINFSIEIGIATRSGNRLQLTKLGRDLLKLNLKFEYELNEQQKDLLTKKCLLAGEASSQVTEILKQFVPAYSSRTYQWSAVDNTPLSADPSTVEIMRQSGLLRRIDGTLEVDHKYVALVRNMLKPPELVTPEELIVHLKNADFIGRIAENIVLYFEKKRLQALNCLAESECIQKISDLNVAAGYDIASFDGQNLDLVHDRFIEVKGSTGTHLNFYWSKNEIEQAKMLGSKYWIYFVGKIDEQSRTSNAEPILIRDPAKSILQNSRFKVECQQFYVTGKN